MAQHDYNIANQSGASFRQDLNNALSAIVTLNSGAASPSTTFAYQLWADTTAGTLKIRNAANNAWITLAELDGTLTMETGSAGSPGLYFRGDTNTGFFSAAADELAIATGGIQRLMIDSSGRVLLGPGAAGRAVGGAVVAQLGIETLGQALSLVRNSADTSGAIIALGKSRATTAGGITAVQDADILGELRFCGANGTDLTSIGAHIRAIVTGVVGSGGDLTDMPTSLAFSVTPDGEATAAEAMRIDPNKRVLIGTTTSTGTKVEVSTPTDADGIRLLFASTPLGGTGPAISFSNYNNSNSPINIASVKGVMTGGSAGAEAGALVFYTSTAGGAPAERMRITDLDGIRLSYTGTPLGTTGPSVGFLNYNNSSSPINTSTIQGIMTGGAAGAEAGALLFSTMASGGSPTERMRIGSAGEIYFPSVGTTASAANAFLNNGSSPANQLLRSTSSLRYKTDIEDLEQDRSDSILNFRPVWYRSTAEADRSDWSWYGLIAEEVADIEPRLVHWTYLEDAYEEVEGERQLKSDAEMVPDGVQYDRLTVLLLDVVQRQQQAIETLEAKVAALEAA